MTHTAKTGFKTFEAARDDLKTQGFTACGPYAKVWTHQDGTEFAIRSGLKGKTGQSARGAAWIWGYGPK